MKKPKDSRERLLIETSIQYEKFKPGSNWPRIQGQFQLFTSYYVWYEFKVGLIASMIRLYFLVNASTSPAVAIGKWSNKYRPRELTNKVLVEAIMLDVLKSVSGDKRTYMRQLHAVIRHLLAVFHVGVKEVVGDFSEDPIVKYQINTPDDYQEFIDLLSSAKFIPLAAFWEKYSAELNALMAEPLDEYDSTPALKTIRKHLAEVVANRLALGKVTIVRGIGDPVIAVDAPSSLTMATLDHSFGVLSPRLDKPYRIFKRQEDGLTLS